MQASDGHVFSPVHSLPQHHPALAIYQAFVGHPRHPTNPMGGVLDHHLVAHDDGRSHSKPPGHGFSFLSRYLENLEREEC
jgi:hypothetical protein